MTRRERVLQALGHQKTDFVPYHMDFTKESYEKVVAYTGDEDFYAHTGGHLMMNEYSDFREVASGMWCDHFGVVWNRTKDKDIGMMDNILITDDNIR